MKNRMDIILQGGYIISKINWIYIYGDIYNILDPYKKERKSYNDGKTRMRRPFIQS